MKEYTMIIVHDIQDAITMQAKLASLLRRSDTFGMSKSDLQEEIEMMVSDLSANVQRMEENMEEYV